MKNVTLAQPGTKKEIINISAKTEKSMAYTGSSLNAIFGAWKNSH